MWSGCPWNLELSHCFPCWLCFSLLNVAGAIRSLCWSDALPLGAACPSALIQAVLPRNRFPKKRRVWESCGTRQAYYTHSFPACHVCQVKSNWLSIQIFLTLWMNWGVCKGVCGLVPYCEQQGMKKKLIYISSPALCVLVAAVSLFSLSGAG